MLLIRPTTVEDASQVSECIDFVARERRFLASTQGFSLEQTRDFIESLLTSGGLHLVVLDEAKVVGWCDISPQAFEGLGHVGRLGMGLLPAYRNQGWGRKLLNKALQLGFEARFERIELEVFSENIGAIKLYKQAGFSLEGRKLKARKLDHQYEDILLFALFKS